MLTFNNNPQQRMLSLGLDLITLRQFTILLLIQQVSCETYTINTNDFTIKDSTDKLIVSGSSQYKTFTGPNGDSWNHTVARFVLSTPSHKDIFKSQHSITIKGNNSLSLNAIGNLTIGTKLDVSGRSVEGEQGTLFVVGGFVRTSNSCCVLGAGPGAAFSYHGAGHGGRGGGFYQDHNTSRYFSWEYNDINYLLGGSTGTVLFDSKPGSGGGAIEIIADNGTLTINAEINADGYTSHNTSKDHCAGGSAGGLIRLRGNNVVIRRKLSAKGGSSGFSHKDTPTRCGDGGGGGVIQIFALQDTDDYLSTYKYLHVHRGKGLSDGEEGIAYLGILFNDGVLDINTTDCTMKWFGLLLHSGTLITNTYRTPDDKMTVSYKVCTFTFDSSVYIGSGATMNIKGQYSLRIVSKNGSIHIMTDVNLSGDKLGGFEIHNLIGRNEGPGNVTNCNATGLYEDDLDVLVGGSVCNSISGGAASAIGGGAIEIRAEYGDLVIGKSITADGQSDNDNAGAMGGIIRIIGKQVYLKDTAHFSAKSSSSGKRLASGGVIQIMSRKDIKGLCETRFDVTGGSSGLVNIMVSAESSYQVQFIQDGQLSINTTLCRWSHRPVSNYSIAYTQYGTTNGSVCTFRFQTPIIVNGSALVKLSGHKALAIHSLQGMYIGSDFIIDSSMIAGMDRFLGGYCINKESQGRIGKGPGKGYPGIAAGGGHGGRGGLFREEDNYIHGNEYGVQPLLFDGGSTGTSRNTGVRGCGGGAISITSTKNLTIDASIKANGYATSLFSGDVGGSSGGTIMIGGINIILKGGAVLEAKGSNATSSNSTGGGGGGVISITTKLNLIGEEPNVTIATSGGQGSSPGESGVVIINGVEKRQYVPDIEDNENSLGCHKLVSSALLSKKMLEHLARPIRCLQICKENKYLFAVIHGKTCNCLNDMASLESTESQSCNRPCRASFKYQCGGKLPNIVNVYKTGVILPTTEPPTEPPTTRPFGEPSPEFKDLSRINITANNSQEVVNKLLNLTTESNLNGGDTQAAVSIITKIATSNVLSPENTNQTKDYGQAIVETASHLLGSKNTDSWNFVEPSNDTSKEQYSANSLLKAMEKIGISLGKGLESQEQVTIESKHLVMGIERRDLTDFKGSSFPNYEKLSESWRFADSITIPEESVNQLVQQGTNQTTIVFLLYEGISDALKRNLASDKMINSRVLSLEFGQKFPEPFEKPVVITFTKRENWKNLTDPHCSFLDFNNSVNGEWSTYGCKMTSSHDDQIVRCECNHLTNFAVLMQVKEFKVSRGHQKALQMITYVGCGISLFGLALTLATFLSLETLASERTSIHKNLVVAIGLAQIIFLAGIDAVYNPIACKIVALSLHYLYMAAFTWMCCEGIHLYTKVIEVFSSETSKMKYYYMLGWGVPLIIVIISAASRMSGYGTETACWISIKHGLIWAFVGPVLIIMSINFVVMVMVIKVILASVTSIQTPGNTSQVKAGLKGMVVLLPLLGLTWVFGLMAVNEKTIAFQYIFAILNSLQGLFIFAFHCIGNSEVRVAYKRLHEKRTLAKMPEHSLSTGNHHKNVQEFKRRMNSRETNSTGDEDIIVTKAIRSVSDVKLSGAHDHMAMQTFGDADSGRWSLNCPSPDPPCVSYQPAVKRYRREPRAPPVISNESFPQPKTPRESYRSNRDNVSGRDRAMNGERGYQRF